MAIVLKNIVKSYATQTVLDDVSLELASGQFTAFIGPNGAGKSTLLAVMSRLEQADQGEVWLDGEAMHQMHNRDIAKKLAILKQFNHTELRLSVKELVAFGRYPHSQGRLQAIDHEKIAQAIRYMDLCDLQDKQVAALSGGQRQRAYIAMTLAQDTDYILLDEPLNNLDMKHSARMMQLLKRLCVEQKKSIIVVIHDINFASVYADQIVAMKAGRVCYQSSPQALMNEECLADIFDFHIPIHQVNQHQLGLYFISQE